MDEQGNVRAKETARADPDFASVEEDKVEVEERVLADAENANDGCQQRTV